MEIDSQAILEFWFGDAAEGPAAAAARERFWFGGSGEVDATIRRRFERAVAAAARGELESWLDQPRAALALVILLDQFPRHIWRGTVQAFAHDGRARRAARAAIAAAHLPKLSPIEQAFLVLPFHHSESLEDQRDAVRLSEQIAQDAPAAWRSLLERYRANAEEHLALIQRFGRFPHRNRILDRVSTPEERDHLAAGGATYGQAAG